MKTYTITLTEAEDKALASVVFDQNEWIQNAIHERCRIAIDDIVQQEVERRLSVGESISGSKEDIVLDANIESVVEKQNRLQQEYKKLQEEQQQG